MQTFHGKTACLLCIEVSLLTYTIYLIFFGVWKLHCGIVILGGFAPPTSHPFGGIKLYDFMVVLILENLEK